MLDRLPRPLFSVNQAYRAKDAQPFLTRMLNSDLSRAAAGADIVDNDHVQAAVRRQALDKLHRSVLLRLFANQEAVDFETSLQALAGD